MSYADLLAELDRVAADPEASCALRIDGEFERILARSVPRQLPPYKALTEVVADQHVFELAEVEGTVVGFRFPDYARGLEAEGYHLHFISADRERGGHVLDCRPRAVTAAIDLSGELHVELPPGVELDSAQLDDETAAALARAEGKRLAERGDLVGDRVGERPGVILLEEVLGRQQGRLLDRGAPAWHPASWSRPSAGSRSPQTIRAG